MENTSPVPEYLERKPTVCTKCKVEKRPTKGYLRMLKVGNEPYICRKCREAEPAPPMNLGKLGWL